MTASSFADDGPESALTPEGDRAAVARGVWPLELLRYFLCSVLALAVDWGIFSAALALGVPWSGAAAIGFCGGLLVAYVLSIRFAFVQRSMRDPRVEFTLFALIGVGGLILTEIILWVLIERAGQGPHESKLVASGFVFLFNFSARKLMLFRVQPRAVSSH